MELQRRTSITPKEPIEHIICEIDPRKGPFVTLPPTEKIDLETINGMPERSYIDTEMSPDALRRLRKMSYQGLLPGDYCFDTIGSVHSTYKVRVYRLPTGSYYGPAQEAFFDMLDNMEKWKLHYFGFANGDTLQLFWHRSKKWTEMRAEPLRIMSTYEGIDHTVQVRRVPEDKMTLREATEMQKIRAKIERANKVIATRRTPKPMEERELHYEQKPYHTMGVGERVVMSPGEFTTIESIRVVVYSYGKRNGKKFSVRKSTEGGVVIHRTI